MDFHRRLKLLNGGINFPNPGVLTVVAPLSMPRSTSARPNSPTVNGTNSIPPCSAGIPKSKRAMSVTTSKPTIPQSKPIPPLNMPLKVEPGVE